MPREPRNPRLFHFFIQIKQNYCLDSFFESCSGHTLHYTHFLNVSCNSIKTKLKQIKNNLRITHSSRSLSHPLQGSRGLGVLWRLSLMSTRLPRKNPHCLRQIWWAKFHTSKKRRWGAWGLSEPNESQDVFLQVCHNSVNQNVIPERLSMVPASKPLAKMWTASLPARASLDGMMWQWTVAFCSVSEHPQRRAGAANAILQS